ncbi:MAG: hypothetical protein R3E52_13215 [Burkholderiaceae bacterium]
MSTTAETLRAEIARLQKELDAATRCLTLSVRRESKADLLLAASKKDVRYFIQFDIFPGGGDDVSNVDGDGMYAGARAELRNIECPRIQIPVGMNHADALRCIDKLRDWAARAPELFNVEIEPEADDFEGVQF